MVVAPRAVVAILTGWCRPGTPPKLYVGDSPTAQGLRSPYIPAFKGDTASHGSFVVDDISLGRVLTRYAVQTYGTGQQLAPRCAEIKRVSIRIPIRLHADVRSDNT